MHKNSTESIEMRKIYIIFLFLSISLSQFTNAQQATINFESDKAITVWIRQPICGNYNNQFTSDSIELKKNISINYKIEITDFGFIYCLFSNGYRCRILLTPNDNVELSYINNSIQFKGSNANGQKILNSRDYGYYSEKAFRYFKLNISEKIDFKKIDKTFEDSIATPLKKELKLLVNNNLISKMFSDNLYKNYEYAFASYFYEFYCFILKGQINKYIPTTGDSIEINKRINNIFENPYYINENNFKYPNSFISTYYMNKWNGFTKEKRAELRNGYTKETLGVSMIYLSAPKILQPSFFGKHLLTDIITGNDMSQNLRLFAYIKEKFPDCLYLPIITKLLVNNLDITKSIKSEKAIILESEKYNTLKDFSVNDKLKGRFLYIDLWSVPCVPCKYEFQFNDELHKLLSKYENLTQVYISTDPVEQDSVWRKTIEKYKLNSYNIRASANLQKELSEKLYNGGSIYIPRYILLDQNANIINDNLPRPSKMNLLEEALDKVFKK